MKGPSENPGTRLLTAARRFNRNPKLLARVRRTRERALGDEQFVDHLSTARGRPADLAAQQLVALRGEEPGVLGELGLTALQAWQRLAESQDRGRGKVDVAILVSGRTAAALDRAAVETRRRQFSAKGAPKDLSAYAVYEATNG